MKSMAAAFLMLSCVGGVAHARETQVMTFAAPASGSPIEAEAPPGDASPAPIGSEATGAARSAPVDLPGSKPITGITSFPTDRLSVPAWMRRGGTTPSVAPIPVVPAMSTTCGAVVYRPLPGVSGAVEARRSAYFYMMASAACEAGIPLELYDALILQESQYRPFVVSPKGAAGMAQLMPQAARDLNVSNVWDAAENLRAGARYLRAQIDAFARYDLAIGAYKAGPQRIRQYGGLPPFRETQAYVARILTRTRLHLALRNRGGFGTSGAIAVASVPRMMSAVTSF